VVYTFKVTHKAVSRRCPFLAAGPLCRLSTLIAFPQSKGGGREERERERKREKLQSFIT
jgi:hypothetical protein